MLDLHRLSCPAIALLLAATTWGAAATAQTTTTETQAPAPEAATETAPAAAPSNTDADTVIATVNGEEVTLGDMIALRMELPAQYQSIPDTVLYTGILDQITSQILLRQAAERSGFADLPSVKRGLDFQRTSYLAELYARDRLNDAITEETIAKEYENRYLKAEAGTEYNARHILLEDEAKATEISGLAKAEGADFAELAKTHSTGPSSANGGDLGWFREGQMVPQFQDAVFAMEEGAVSDPVQTQFGWHVIKLEATRAIAPPALADVQEELIGTMSNEITSAVVDALREEAQIDASEDQLGLDQLRNDALLADE